MYPKNDGIGTPASSAIDFTMKLGAFPMYVFAPMKTDPVAIACRNATGSVFMGANTYIGNAPNFMVKSIAEEAGVSMPSFFGYILRYSLPVLIPVFALVTWLFFG